MYFRQWATRTLREHLVRGFTLNEQRLAERGLAEARATVNLLARTLKNQALVDDTGQAVPDLITAYTDTWRLLLEYDEDWLKAPSSTKPATSALALDQVIAAIDPFRQDLATKGQATRFFGNRRGEALDGILGNIEQTMFGEPLYRSREEKAANLLYFIVKDHPTSPMAAHRRAPVPPLPATGGCATPPDPRTLTALTLPLAESAPADKELMIALIINLLVEMP